MPSSTTEDLHSSTISASSTISGASTTSATSTEPATSPPPSLRSSYFTYPVSYAVSGLLRRLSYDPSNSQKDGAASSTAAGLSQSFQSISEDADAETRDSNNHSTANMNSVFQPPRRKLSPFQPPPLTPLTLHGWKASTTQKGRLLTKALAEEIRLLMPPRLQLVDEWELCYSLEQNGVSLATLYEKCDYYRGKRGGFVLVVRDGSGGVSISLFNPSPRIFLLRRALSCDGSIIAIYDTDADLYLVDDLDLRSIPLRPTPPIPPFLRQRRMFPMAGFRSPCSPRQGIRHGTPRHVLTPSPAFRRYNECATHDHHPSPRDISTHIKSPAIRACEPWW